MNKTAGPLQQHLQLLAGTNQTYNAIREAIMEYYRATTAFSKMQATQQVPSSSIGTSYNGGSAPMDIGALYKERIQKAKEKATDTEVKEEKAKVKEAKATAKERHTKVTDPSDKDRYTAAKDGSDKATKEKQRARTKERLQ